MKTIIISTLIALLGFSAMAQSSKVKIAVMPFGYERDYRYNYSPLATLAENLTTSVLHNSGRFTVVERKELDKILAEQRFNQSGLVNDDDAIKLGRLSGAKFIALGNISNISYNTQTKITPAGVRYQLANAFINLLIKIINVESGDIVFTKTYAFKSEQSRESDREKLLSTLLTNEFEKRVPKEILGSFPIEGTVLFIEGNSVYIDIGSGQGVKKGMVFDVVSTDEKTNSAGRTVRIVKKVAKLQVTAITGDDSAECRIFDGINISDLQEGMRIVVIQ